MPKESEEQKAERRRAIQEATLEAARVPLEVAVMSVEVIELAAQAVSLGNINAISDGASGAALARAALTSAGYNVRINIVSLKDKDLGASLLDQLTDLERQAQAKEAEIRATLIDRGDLPL